MVHKNDVQGSLDFAIKTAYPEDPVVVRGPPRAEAIRVVPRGGRGSTSEVTVRSLALQRDGRILVGGHPLFSSVIRGQENRPYGIETSTGLVSRGSDWERPATGALTEVEAPTKFAGGNLFFRVTAGL